MLRLPAFHWHRPKNLTEALALLEELGPEARPLAGGTDLLPNLKRRHQKASHLVSLGGIRELSGIEESADGLRIGAMTRLTEIERAPIVLRDYPALAEAVASISSPPLREMGTLGGNLCLDTRCTYYNQNEEWRRSIQYCMKAEGRICWVAPSSPRCWAVQSADSVPMLIALGARVRLASRQGVREIPLEELYRDDGIDYLTKQRDELVEAVLLPRGSTSRDCRSHFLKLRRRGAIDFGVLSVAAVVWFQGSEVRKARVVLGSVGSAPVLLEGVEEFLAGRPLDGEVLQAVATRARKHATPMDNTDLDPIWRGQVLPLYVARVLSKIVSNRDEVGMAS